MLVPASSLQHTFLYLSGTDFLTEIDSTSSFSNSPAGLDSNGDVSGTAGATTFFYNGVLNNGSLNPLRTLFGGAVSYGNGMNASGTVVGVSEGSQNFPFSWSNVRFVEPKNLGHVGARNFSQERRQPRTTGSIVHQKQSCAGGLNAITLVYALYNARRDFTLFEQERRAARTGDHHGHDGDRLPVRDPGVSG